ncbi:MAG: FeoB-associated Cys-rich membrane protein [Clostridia bacterium]|nr:FeoB-associated Cys-rich membrane protein [Clostridia bacterium]
MGEWLAQNAATIVISLILAGAAAAIIAGRIRSRKQGRTSCGCGCAHCALHDQCHKR